MNCSHRTKLRSGRRVGAAGARALAGDCEAGFPGRRQLLDPPSPKCPWAFAAKGGTPNGWN